MSEIYLGKPSEKIVAWCKEKYPPVEPEPIVQTSDGKLKITSIKDETTSSTDTFNVANNWLLTGSGFYQESTAPSGEWHMQETSANIGGVFCTFSIVEIASDNTYVKIKMNDPIYEAPEKGTYGPITLTYQVSNYSLNPEQLWIELAHVVVS